MSETSIFDLGHIATGRALLRVHDEPDLSKTVEIWDALYERNRAAVLAYHVRSSPGTRPRAWWLFDDTADDRHDDETETAYLSRIGELQPTEIEAIIAQALRLADHNRARHPDDASSNFVAPSGPVRWACETGLVSEEVSRVLCPDRFKEPTPLRVVRSNSTNGVSSL